MALKNTFKISVAQFAPALGDVAANAKACAAWCRQAKAKKAQALVLPELILNGYLLEDLASDTALKRQSAEVKKLAQASRGLHVAAGAVFEDAQQRIYNSGLRFEKGKLASVHHKMYLPSYGMFDEARYFTQGSNLELFDWGPFKTAMLLCEDAWHASLPLIAVQKGAQLIVVLASSPARGFKSEAQGLKIQKTWQRVLGAMAQTLGVYVVFANRVGAEDGLGFWGGSQIFSPEGETLAQAALFKEDSIQASLDADALRRARVAQPIAAAERLDFDARAFAELAGWTLQGGKEMRKKE